MKSTKCEPPSIAHQLAMALDSVKLRGMCPAERNAAVVLLASLLMEAAGVAVREDANDRV